MAKKIDLNGLDHFKEKENAMIASEYSSSKTYAVGDYVYHNGTLYKCTTAITTAEAWTSGHWTAAKLADDCSGLMTAIKYDYQYFTPSEWLDHKYWNSGGTMSTSGAQYNYHAYPSIALKAGTYYVYECADAYSFKKVNGTVSSLSVTQLNYSPYRGVFILDEDAEVMITASPSHEDTSLMMLSSVPRFPSDANTNKYNVYFGDIVPLLSNSIVVDKSGQGDFTTIQDAIDSIIGDTDSVRYNIVVMPGTYPTFETKSTGDSNWRERYINIIGVDLDNTVVLSDVGLYSKATKTRLNGVVKNITFKMTNTNQGDVSQESYNYAYAIHPDFGEQHTRFENCKFYSTNGPALGFGLASNTTFLEFIGCYFECNQNSAVGTSNLGALFGHSTNSPNVTGMKIILNNCICNNITGSKGAYITQLVESTSQSFIATNSVFVGDNGASIVFNGTWDKGYSANNNVEI